MASDRYFSSFPTTTYNNTPVVDITKRVVFRNNVLKNPYVFYPYEIASSERPDQLSHRYYEDHFKSWAFYLANQVVDPYYEWYMDQNTFDQFIVEKYGSVTAALEKTCYYYNNWASGSSLTPDGYAALVPTLKRYYEPVVVQTAKSTTPLIQSYRRRQIEQTINTNGVRSYAVGNSSFVADEKCTVVFDVNNTGSGQALSVIDGVLYIQHVAGTTLSNTTVSITANSYVYGHESGTNTVFTSSTAVANNLLDEEVTFWSPLSYYDFEQYKNEYNKTIRVLDKQYAGQLAVNMRNLLKDG